MVSNKFLAPLSGTQRVFGDVANDLNKFLVSFSGTQRVFTNVSNDSTVGICFLDLD